MATRQRFVVRLVTLSIGVSVVYKSKSTPFTELRIEGFLNSNESKSPPIPGFGETVVPDSTRFAEKAPATAAREYQNHQHPDTCDLCQRKWNFLVNFEGPLHVGRLRTSLGARVAPVEAERAIDVFSRIKPLGRGGTGTAFSGKPMDNSKYLCKLQSLVAAAVSSVTSEDVQSRVFIATIDRKMLEVLKKLFPCAKFIEELRELEVDNAMSDSSATNRTRPQKAIARNDQICACDARHRLIVLASGRSGSTTTMNMLNQVPGMYISGETKLLDHLYVAMSRWSASTFRNPPFLCAVRDLVDVSIGDFHQSEFPIYGFKEVSFGRIEKLELVRSIYPCAKFVINTRANLDKQALSGWYKGNMKWVRHKHAILKSFKHACKFDLELGTNFDATGFTKLLRFVGVQGCFYKALMHSNKGGYGAGNMSRTLSGNCSMDLKSW